LQIQAVFYSAINFGSCIFKKVAMIYIEQLFPVPSLRRANFEITVIFIVIDATS